MSRSAPKGLADRRDVHAKRILLNKDAPPHPLREFVLGNQIALGLDQFCKDFKGPPP
jgi:hypothetical protein